jgi:hypothetical protein
MPSGAELRMSIEEQMSLIDRFAEQAREHEAHGRRAKRRHGGEGDTTGITQARPSTRRRIRGIAETSITSASRNSAMVTRSVREGAEVCGSVIICQLGYYDRLRSL